MARGNYIKRKQSTDALFVSVEDYVDYIYLITNNDKAFPKAYRYTFVQDIRRTCDKLYKQTSVVVSLNCRYRKEAKKILKKCDELYITLLEIKAMVRLAIKIHGINVQNPGMLADKLTKTSDNYNRFVRSIKNRLNNLPSHKEYKEQARQRALDNQRKAAWNKLKRDEDGFIILKFKDSFPLVTDGNKNVNVDSLIPF